MQDIIVTRIYIQLNKDYLAKETAAANKRAIDRFASESDKANLLFWDEKELTADNELSEVAIDPDSNTLETSVTTEIGTISFRCTFPLSVQVDLLESLVKRVHKVKAVMEAVS